MSEPYCISCGKPASWNCVITYHDILGKKELLKKLSYRYLTFIRKTYEMMGCWLGTATSNFPRYQVELDPEDWEKLMENVKFMEDLREELKDILERLK